MKKSILIVEDEAVISLTIEHTLVKLGYHVAGMVPSGEECIEILRSTEPDLILMDIRLAGALDGIETADVIRKMYDIPVVFLTAFSGDDVIRRVKEVNPLGYLVKPFQQKDLMTTLEMAFFRADLERKLAASEKKFRDIAETADYIVMETDPGGRFRYLNPYGKKILFPCSHPEGDIQLLDFVFRDNDRELLKRKFEMRENDKDEFAHSRNEIKLKAVNKRIFFFEEQLRPVFEKGSMVGLRGALINTTKSRYKDILQSNVSELSDLLRNENIFFDDYVMYVVKLLKGLTGADSVYFSKYEGDSDIMLIYTDAPDGKVVSRKKGKGLSELVIEERQPLFLAGKELDDFQEKRGLKIYGERAKCWIGIPLKIGKGVYGVLALQSHSCPEFFSADDFTVFMDLCREISFVFQGVLFRRIAAENESRYRTLVESINEGILQVDLESDKIEFVNKRFLELLEMDAGIVFNEVRFSKLYFFRQNEALFDGLKRTLLAGESAKFEIQVNTPGGEAKIFIVSNTPMLNKLGHVDRMLSVWLDITDQRKIEMESRENSERLNEIVKNIKEGFWLVDCQSKKILYSSPSFGEIYDSTLKQINRKQNLWFSLVHPEDRHLTSQFFEKAAQGPYEAEFRIRTAAGETKWVHERAYPIADGNGNVVRIAGYVLDITARKLAQRELAESESDKRAIVNAIPDSLLIVSDTGEIIDHYLKQELGSDVSMCKKKVVRFFDLFDKENARRLQSVFRNYLENEQDSLKDVTFFNKLNGRWYEFRFVRIDESKTLVLVRDISSNKKQEYELKKFFNLIEQSEEMIMITDKAGTIEYVNPRLLQVTGYSAAELIGRRPNILSSGKHSKKFFARFWQTILSGNPFSGEVTNRKKNGELYVEEKFVTPLFDENGELVNYISTSRDVTEKKNTEQKLEAYRKLQEYQEKTQTRIRMLSLMQGQEEERKRIARDLHDGLGQILTATKIYLERVNDSMKKDKTRNENFAKVYKMVVETIQEVRRVSNDLSPSGLDDFGLHAAVKNLVAKLEESQISIRIQIHSALERMRFKSNIEINVFRIIQEALNNALKYSGADTIEINLLYSSGLLRVSIMDNGRGFLQKQELDGVPTGASGSGLGNIKERAKMIGGQLVVITEKDQGVLVTFEIKTQPVVK